MKMFKEKVIKGLICLLAIGMLASSLWGVMAEKPGEEQGRVKETQPKAEAKKIQGGVQMEKYVPKVIIEAKWHKVKEKLVIHEMAPPEIISCGTEIQGRFGEGTVSFGWSNYNILSYEVERPRCLTIDEYENLYILDPLNFRILKFDKDGKYLDTINLERIKPKKGQLGRFEIAKGCDLDRVGEIYIDKDGYIYIKNLKFSEKGRFIGTKSTSIKEKYRFISSIQDPNKGIVQVVDQGKNLKKEFCVNLDPKLAKKGYTLENIKIWKRDKEENFYIETIIESPDADKYIKQIYKYNSNGIPVFNFAEREENDYVYILNYSVPLSIAITDDGTVYELVISGIRKLEGKRCTYKLDPSDKKLKEIEDIDEFLKQREEFIKEREEFIKEMKKDGTPENLIEEMYGKEGYSRKITLYTTEGGYYICEKLEVIKWEKE
jgi:hypothetical protein